MRSTTSGTALRAIAEYNFYWRLALASNLVTIILTYARYGKVFGLGYLLEVPLAKTDTLTTTGKFNEMNIAVFAASDWTL